MEFLLNLNVKPLCTYVKPSRTNVKPPIDAFLATVLHMAISTCLYIVKKEVFHMLVAISSISVSLIHFQSQCVEHSVFVCATHHSLSISQYREMNEFYYFASRLQFIFLALQHNRSGHLN